MAGDVGELWGLAGVEVVDERVSFPTRGVIRLTSDRGDYAAKVFADLSCDDVLPGVETLLAARHAGFVHAPEVLAARSGRYVETTAAGAVVVMEFLPVVLNEIDTAATWADLGAALGGLNSLAGTHAFRVPIAAALREQVTRADGTAFEVGVRRLVERLAYLSKVPATGIIHGEANPSNAGRRADGQLVLLDWDQAGTAASAFEYGYPLITCHVSESLHIDEVAIDAFHSAYRAEGGSIDPSLAIDTALFHALRYMWFANTEARWQRIEHVQKIESDLSDLIT